MIRRTKIEVVNLRKSFDHLNVLNGVSFELKEQESLVIIGGSGTGKSVLIKCIMGFMKPDRGHILIGGQDVNSLSRRKRQEQFSKFGMLFQSGALFDSMNVLENIAFSLIQGQDMSPSKAKEVALEKLRAVDLEKRIGHLYPAELSGGMQKRVALARAIASNPEVIFFDEPTTGLDPIISGTINELIKKCVREIGASTITITHDINSVRQIADKVGLLHQGKIIWNGTVKEMDSSKDPYVVQFINGFSTGPFGSDGN